MDLTPDEVVWEKINCPLCSACDEEQLLAVFSEAEEAVYRLVRCRLCCSRLLARRRLGRKRYHDRLPSPNVRLDLIPLMFVTQDKVLAK